MYKAIYAVAALLSAFVFPPSASAQLPVAFLYERTFKEIPLSLNVHSTITVQNTADSLIAIAKIEVDLYDVQQKIGAIVDKYVSPTDECGNTGIIKPNVILSSTPTKSLTVQGDHGILSLAGDLKIISCTCKPYPAFLWSRFGYFRTSSTSPAKRQFGPYPFNATFRFKLVKKNNTTIALQLAQPAVELNDPGALRFLRFASYVTTVDINRMAADKVQPAIDSLNEILATMFAEVRKHSVEISLDSARFMNKDGHLTVAVNLNTAISPLTIGDLVRQSLPTQ
jgi:hypothetical protein